MRLVGQQTEIIVSDNTRRSICYSGSGISADPNRDGSVCNCASYIREIYMAEGERKGTGRKREEIILIGGRAEIRKRFWPKEEILTIAAV